MDQSELYSRGEFKPAWFTTEEIKANLQSAYQPGRKKSSKATAVKNQAPTREKWPTTLSTLNMKIKCFLLLTTLFLRTVTIFPQPEVQTGMKADPFNGFDEFVNAQMAEWKVPGLSIAVIKDGRILLLKGYGYRNVEKKLPVTPRTIMPIGSITKTYTASVLGSLVDEKKLEWDVPVREYMSDFRLSDEVAERMATARDLMAHRVGIPRHDSLWYGRTYTRRELYSRLRYLEFNQTFRERWQYSNLMVTTAGILAERITNRTWEELVRDRLFVPLGMTRSNFTIADITKSDDYSLPYGLVDDLPAEIPYRDLEATCPSGCINSSVEDVIRFVQMQIDKGEYRGKKVISKESALEMQYPQVHKNRGRPINRLSDQDEGPNGLGPSFYGLGLGVTTYRGRKMLGHGGGIDGFISTMAWLPDEKIGLVVLSNWGGWNPVPTILERNILDRLLGLNQIDWVKPAKAYRERIRKLFNEPQVPMTQPTTKPSHPLAEYAGTYTHPGYGTITISFENDRLIGRLDNLLEPIPLEHEGNDTFRPKLPKKTSLGSWTSRRITFYDDKGRKVDRLTIPLEGDVPDIVFKRKALP